MDHIDQRREREDAGYKPMQQCEVSMVDPAVVGKFNPLRAIGLLQIGQ